MVLVFFSNLQMRIIRNYFLISLYLAFQGKARINCEWILFAFRGRRGLPLMSGGWPWMRNFWLSDTCLGRIRSDVALRRATWVAIGFVDVAGLGPITSSLLKNEGFKFWKILASRVILGTLKILVILKAEVLIMPRNVGNGYVFMELEAQTPSGFFKAIGRRPPIWDTR